MTENVQTAIQHCASSLPASLAQQLSKEVENAFEQLYPGLSEETVQSFAEKVGWDQQDASQIPAIQANSVLIIQPIKTRIDGLSGQQERQKALRKLFMDIILRIRQQFYSGKVAAPMVGTSFLTELFQKIRQDKVKLDPKPAPSKMPPEGGSTDSPANVVYENPSFWLPHPLSVMFEYGLSKT